MKLKIFLRVFGIIAILCTIIPFFGANYWWIRVFDFPHLQLTLLTLLAILLYMIRFDAKEGQDLFFTLVLFACFTYQIFKIYPYTEIAPTTIGGTESGNIQKSIKLYTANVLMKNEEYHLLKDEIEKYDADIVLLTEPDPKWQREVSKYIKDKYPYRLEKPLHNSYGMLLYSKVELIDPTIRFLVSDSIPSMHAKLRLDNGDTIQFHAIHPTPPMPTHNPKSTDRDAEMMMIALQARDSKFPVIVLGDFNDVAWSQTTQLFEEVSGLLDMRKGRGLYNTFNAKNILMRWPLDHVFVSEEFRLIDMERGGKIGSDHFPFYTNLNLEPEKAKSQKPEEPTQKEIKRAKEMVRDVKWE